MVAVVLIWLYLFLYYWGRIFVAEWHNINSDTDIVIFFTQPRKGNVSVISYLCVSVHVSLCPTVRSRVYVYVFPVFWACFTSVLVWFQGLTFFLSYAILAAVLGMLQFGYNTGVINAPGKVNIIIFLQINSTGWIRIHGTNFKLWNQLLICNKFWSNIEIRQNT